MKPYCKFVQILLFAFMLSGCNEDDSINLIENHVPEIPVLFAPGDNQINIGIEEVQLKWQHPTDPDDDDLRFDVYFDQQNPPLAYIASGLTTSNFTLDEKLNVNTTYFWKIVTKDGKGGESESLTSSFTTRPPNAEELIVGKWVVESMTFNGEPTPLNDCNKQDNYKFSEDGTLIITTFSPANNSNECSLSISAGQYKILGEDILQVFKSNEIVAETVISISEVQLTILLDKQIEIYRKEL